MKLRVEWLSQGIATRICKIFIVFWLVSGCAPENVSPEAEEARSICAAVPSGSMIVIGELHGTAEAPSLFRELVHCRKKRAKNAPLVGLEIPPEALDAVLKLPVDATRTEVLHGLLRNEFWTKAKDGRTSIAMFELIEYLRKEQKDGRLTVFAFDGRRSATDNFSELAIAELKAELSRVASDSLPLDVLMLTGNGHATIASDSGSLGGGLAAAGMRPYVVQTTFGSGEAWVCRRGQCGTSWAGSGGCEDRTSADIKITELAVHTICLPAATASPPAMSDSVSIGARSHTE